MRIAFVAAVAAIVSIGSGACSDPVAPAAPTPVPPSVTESFSGTLPVNGSTNHLFSVAQIGSVQVKLDSADPGSVLGIGIGRPSGALCNVISSVTIVPGSAPQLAGTATVPGNFCVAVFDVGNLVEPVNYTVTVFHS